MKILVCGSRTWLDEVTISEAFIELDQTTSEPIEIINGGAEGADKLATAYARLLGWPVQEFKPKYDEYPPHVAPLKRNLQMLDENPDLVLAFQVGQSRGTQHTINHARKRGIPVEVYNGQRS